jgi:hypothetical protein
MGTAALKVHSTMQAVVVHSCSSRFSRSSFLHPYRTPQIIKRGRDSHYCARSDAQDLAYVRDAFALGPEGLRRKTGLHHLDSRSAFLSLLPSLHCPPLDSTSSTVLTPSHSTQPRNDHVLLLLPLRHPSFRPHQHQDPLHPSRPGRVRRVLSRRQP